jgi:hypothetical protein
MNPDDKAVPLTQDEGDLAVVQGHDVQGELVGARQARQSHLCCCCCCDVRRAVIVVNAIAMCYAIFLIASSWSMVGTEGYASQFDDDEYLSTLDAFDGKTIGLHIGLLVVGVICQIAGIYGAQNFNRIGVIIGAIWCAVEVIRSIVFGFGLPNAFMYGCFCYPHVVFLQEMKNGIMTPEKYPNESVCCACCV